MPDTKPVAIFCTDLDGTLLGRPEDTARFRQTWEALDEAKPLLVYSTGRLVNDAIEKIEQAGLPTPDYYIGGVGTIIYHPASETTLEEFSCSLSEDWVRADVQRIVQSIPDIEEQPAIQQHQWKSSWFWYDASEEDLDQLRKDLAAAGLKAQVVYSSKRDLDVLPQAANKGNALRWLCKTHDIELDQAVVAGDTGNDSSMFLVPGVRGIAPANAEPELLEAIEGIGAFTASGECTAGVIEGLRQYGVFPNPADSTTGQD